MAQEAPGACQLGPDQVELELGQGQAQAPLADRQVVQVAHPAPTGPSQEAHRQAQDQSQPYQEEHLGQALQGPF